MRLLLLSAGILLLSVALTSSAQEGPESPCITGAKWHLTKAIHYANYDSQDFHLKAADALLKLDGLADNCYGWEQDAQPPAYDPQGNVSKTGAT